MQKASAEKAGDTHIIVPNEAIQLLIKFEIRGNLRFLSHAEMLRVFQRACVRAGMKLQYSQGFNPRPRISLPLPKPVGIEVEDDLLRLLINCERKITEYQSQVADILAAQLPHGCRLLSVSAAETKVSFQPRAATYIMNVPEECLAEKLKTKIADLLASENLILRRKTDLKGGTREVDVRPFLQSVELADRNIMVECVVTPAGSIRVDEILDLLELDANEFVAPIRRIKVQWQ